MLSRMTVLSFRYADLRSHDPHLIDYFTILLGAFVVGLGAFTRLSDSGLGCPDWPACFGHWLVHPAISQPPLTSSLVHKAWIEMIHRYLAGCFAATALLRIGYLVMRRKKHPFFFIGTALIFSAQAAFGAFTVTWKLHPYAVVPHLLGGMFVTVFIFQHLIHSQSFFLSEKTHASSTLSNWLTRFKGLLWLQIFLGGCTSAHYAAMICPRFPSCQGVFSWSHFYVHKLLHLLPIGPNYAYGVYHQDLRVIIHMTHRLGALVLTTALCGMMAFSWMHRGHLSLHTRTQCIRLCILFAFQLGLGMANIVWQLPLFNAVLHNVFALLLLLQTARLQHALQSAARQYAPYQTILHSEQRYASC